jgi:hypothetical protein
MQVQHILHVAIAVGMLCATAPVLAHHGAQVQYDSSRPVEIKGTVKTIEWQYPHAGFTLVVEDPAGKVTTWEFELAGTTNLLRRSWAKNSLRVGDRVSVKAFVARDGSPFANAVDITISDGRPLFGGSPGVYVPRKSQSISC